MITEEMVAAAKKKLRELVSEAQDGPLSSEEETGLDYGAREILEAAEAARPKPEPVAVRVKPLEWHTYKSSMGYKVCAYDPFGMEFGRIDAGPGLSEKQVEELKKVKQADYEARIRSALVAQPASSVAIPTSVEQAELMEKVGFAWLAEHAPERLTELGKERVIVGAPVKPLLGTRLKLSFDSKGRCTSFYKHQVEELHGEWVWLIEATNGMNSPLYTQPPALVAQPAEPVQELRNHAWALIKDLDGSLVGSRDIAVIHATNTSVKRLRILLEKLDRETTVTPPLQEAQEPVAWMHPNGAIWRADNYPAGIDFTKDGWIALYATPRPDALWEENELLKSQLQLYRDAAVTSVTMEGVHYQGVSNGAYRQAWIIDRAALKGDVS